MSYLTFALKNVRPLLFGPLHSFYSAPRQIFIIGPFSASMAAIVGLGLAEIGAFYLGATPGSAFTLMFVGHQIDRVRLVDFSATVVIGLACACLVTALAAGKLTPLIGFHQQRLTRQGLTTHVGATATAHTFDKERGRTLGVTVLGIPLSAVIFPLPAVAGIGSIGWRVTYVGLGAGALFVILRAT